jgi:hypothetical protein
MPEVDYRPRFVYAYTDDPKQLELARTTWPVARFRNLTLYTGEVEIRRPRAVHERVCVTVLLPKDAPDALRAKASEVMEAHAMFPCDIELYVSKGDGEVEQVGETHSEPSPPVPHVDGTADPEEDQDNGPEVPSSPRGRKAGAR